MNRFSFHQGPRSRALILSVAALLLSLSATAPTLAETPNWRPSASERLVKLPGTYIKKAIDQDFQESPLATALAMSEPGLETRLKPWKICVPPPKGRTARPVTNFSNNSWLKSKAT